MEIPEYFINKAILGVRCPLHKPYTVYIHTAYIGEDSSHVRYLNKWFFPPANLQGGFRSFLSKLNGFFPKFLVVQSQTIWEVSLPTLPVNLYIDKLDNV